MSQFPCREDNGVCSYSHCFNKCEHDTIPAPCLRTINKDSFVEYDFHGNKVKFKCSGLCGCHKEFTDEKEWNQHLKEEHGWDRENGHAV